MKLLKIGTCLDCPNLYEDESQYLCNLKEIPNVIRAKTMEIDELNWLNSGEGKMIIIPIWCPLPDFTEE
jgi:hypothetical protein